MPVSCCLAGDGGDPDRAGSYRSLEFLFAFAMRIPWTVKKETHVTERKPLTTADDLPISNYFDTCAKVKPEPSRKEAGGLRPRRVLSSPIGE
jgi:hypothetical protein